MDSRKTEYIVRSEKLIKGRSKSPGFLYNSGVNTESPYSVRFLSKEDENEELTTTEKKSTSSVFNTSSEFEDGSISFDVFSKVFLEETGNRPKSYFETVPIVIRKERGQSYNVYHKENLKNLVSKKSENDEESNTQWEKHEAKALFNYFENNEDYGNTGISIVDFEMPLAVARPDPSKLSAVDLIGLSSDKKTAYLLELKNVKSVETLVRSSLEIYTYYSRLGLNRSETRKGVISRIKKDYGSIFNDVSDIRPGVLLLNGSNQHKVYVDMTNGDTRYMNVKKLMEKLGIDVFVVSRYNGETVVPFTDETDAIEYQEVENDKSKVCPIVKLASNEVIRIDKIN